MTERDDPFIGHLEIARMLVDTINVYGRQTPLRYANEDKLIYFITEALQKAHYHGSLAHGEQAAGKEE